MSYIVIENGTLHDPTNDIDGVVQTLWLRDGKVVAPPTEPNPEISRRIDARGYVVMPGGVDLHCHIAGPKVNAGRKMTPEYRREHRIARTERTRSATGGLVPSTFGTGYMFAGLGYTTAMDAAIPGLHARHAHEELADTPLVDKGFYLLFGNNHFVLDHLREGRRAELDAYLGWSLHAAKAYAMKIVNPGGVENWKQISRKTLQQLDEPVPHFGVTPRQVVRELAAAADRLRLPHALHIHCNNLGMPGNYRTALHTMESLEGSRGHFAHVQFHSYGGDENDPSSFASAAPALIDYVNEHENITVDVGHVNPGRTLGMTGDAPFAQHLAEMTGNRWFAADCEQESSCGVIPMEFHPQKVLVHAIQWAIALEWYLRIEDPWRVCMSSDHPNGGAIYRYPEIIHLLMDADFRREAIGRMHGELSGRTTLADLDREYSLQEIAIITRAAPARTLGLSHKGHLAIGADADVTIYAPQQDIRAMFERPRYVLQAGRVICEEGQVLSDFAGRTIYAEPTFDADFLPHIENWFNEHYTIRFRNYTIAAESLASASAIACG
ncbi:formylmethanofuran dehydrogenase subunit A [Blastopirellula sp. J2-11]|uniref:formylmethanofuran dehydrogenase subunit A n=1 Tax=Blastopirellula sp. J2-11 TaxID=2943192 RepID=UPI0021C5D7FD|nr:formylmethanofuran dehydrogenase subunit A [Blastopirellula sp. J2-11]UUO07341.1 formylmethanofuran dehydrogenase subunit A [Blastopirellula sp. J2-11]